LTSDETREGTIADFAEVVVGGTPSTRRAEYWGPGITWVTPTDVTATAGRSLAASSRSITAKGLIESSARLVPKGSVLVTTRATIGPAVIAATDVATNQGVTALVPRPGVSGTWLYYWVLANRDEFVSRGAGNTFPEISRAKTRAIPMVVSSPTRQGEVVRVLSAVDDALDAARLALVEARRAKNALVEHVLAGAAAGAWGSAPLETAAGADGVFTDGDWILSEDLKSGREVRLLQLGDIGVGRFLDKSSKWISRARYDALHCTAVLPGDILISRMAEPIARACIVPDLGVMAITAVDVTILRCDEELVDPRFVMQTLNSLRFRYEAEQQSAGGTRRRITRKKLALLNIPIPPLSVQRELADLWAAADDLVTAYERRHVALAVLKRAAVRRLFANEDTRSDASLIGAAA